MSGDKQTLRELRHQILARGTVRFPPPDVVPGLNIQPLREHAWLDSLADARMVADASFYDRLARDFGPAHPLVVDLGSNNDFIAIMDEVGTSPSTFGREPTVRRTKIAIGESSSMAPSCPEPIPERDNVLHSGIWLPPDYCSGPKNTASNSAVELLAQYVEYQRVFGEYEHVTKDLQNKLDAAVARADQLQMDLDAEKATKAETDIELVDLRQKADQLQEAEKKRIELELALKTA
ncbi:hypothetical protein BVRB_4g082970 [Beta vulgaris subsp. vulgaris]|nr:hypothetical protein BVRB_4g082970 [Beta vulgaris subsp. vulgaris]